MLAESAKAPVGITRMQSCLQVDKVVLEGTPEVSTGVSGQLKITDGEGGGLKSDSETCDVLCVMCDA